MDVSKLDISTTILGYKTSSPIMIAPTGMQGLAHPEGIYFFWNMFANCLLVLSDIETNLYYRGNCNCQSCRCV